MENKLEKILELVSEYIKDKKGEESFTAGEDWVKYSGPYFDDKEYVAAVETLLSEWLIFGEKAREFEQTFAPNHMGRKYGALTNSGSSANLLMVSSLTSRKKMNKWYIPPGSKFITPVVCFPTTLNPLIQNGFEPVFVDVDIPSLNPNLDEVEQILKKAREEGDDSIRGIMFAHVLGNPPDLDRLMKLVDEYDLIFLEDACDALGSTYKGKKLGTFGLMSTCSFFPAHHMTMGEGGFIATDEYRLKTMLNSFRDWGRACYCNERKPGDVTSGTACGNRFSTWFPDQPDVTYDHRYVFDEIGYNIKPLDLQAAMGLQQLDKLPGMDQARRDNFRKLTEIFAPYESYFHMPEATEGADPCWFGFLLTVKEDAPFSKQVLVNFLEDSKIQTRSYFTGNVLYHPGYKHLTNLLASQLRDRYPNAHLATKNTFFLGTFIGLTDEKISYIKEKVDDFMTNMEKYKHERGKCECTCGTSD